MAFKGEVVIGIITGLFPEHHGATMIIDNIGTGYWQLSTLSVLDITGKDAQAFLQGQVTIDMMSISINQGSLAAFCNLQGRIMATCWLWQISEDEGYRLVLPKLIIPKLLEHLQPYAVFSKIKFTEPDDLSVFAIIDSKNAFALADKRHALNSQKMMTVDSEQKRAIYIAKDTPDSWKQLSKLTNNEWQLLEIHQGFAHVVTETQAKFIPQMLDLEKQGGLSFSKGCYLGQEIIARSQYRGQLKRHLYYAEMQATQAPSIGEIIKAAENEAGYIVNVAAMNKEQYCLLAVLQDRAIETLLGLTKIRRS